VNACFLTGPVAVRPEVQAAFSAPPVSHRDADFVELMHQTRSMLGALVNASHVTLMVGSGTLANDAVAAQLALSEGEGLVLANGEFGERLIDHARRWRLRFVSEQQCWGQAFDWQQVRRNARRRRPAWIWAVLTETSTGIANPLHELLELADGIGADLCLDAVSAIGLMPVDLRGVRFATAVSGKGLAAYPGLAAVFHDGRLANAGQIPRYLDLADYEAAASVPFTHSSNLLAALESSLSLTHWPGKFLKVRRLTRELHGGLRRVGLPPLAREEHAASGVITVPVPPCLRAGEMSSRLANQGIDVACHSAYLRQRNWLQMALMGEVDESALRRLPRVLGQIIDLSRRPQRVQAM
jgi:aspartate aminotransferase-like enzyme